MTREILMPPEQNLEEQKKEEPKTEVKEEVTTTNNFEALIQGALADAERARRSAEARARELEDQMNEMKRAPVVPATTEKELDYWKDPVTTIKTLIQDQVAPLYKIAETVNRQNEYSALKAQYVNYPGFKNIEGVVDQMMQGQTPSHAAMQVAIQRAVGHLAMTNPQALWGNQEVKKEEIKDSKVVGEITPAKREVDLQAHLRPSKGISDLKDQTKSQRRPLTENERRLIRDNGITEDRFWELLEAPVNVDSWKEAKK